MTHEPNLDVAQLVRDNNRQASKTGQLLGMKAQAVRNIMEHFDREARKLLIDYTVNVGHENTPWTDDNLSSKKFKSNAGPVWQARGKVTDESNRVKHQINSHRKIPANLRKKLDKKQMESLSEEAAFVVAVKAEVLQAMPVDPNALHTGWVELYENGDPGVVLEVQSAIMNRSCPNVSEIATLASIMNKHTGSTPLPSKAVMEMEKLEAETFALKMKQLDYDVQALRVSRAKRTSWQLQVHHAKLQYRAQTFNESIKAAKSFMADCSRIITFANTDELIRSITAFMGEKTAQLKLDESGNAAQAGAAAFILGQSGRNVGMMLCPEFTYRKNELWLLEHAITKMLCHKGVDARDNVRPLNYRGRFLEGVSAKLKEKDFLWRNALLWKEGRTEYATQMLTKDMVAVEATLEDSSTGAVMAAPDSEEYLFGGARKVEQVGQNACEKLLQGMMKDLSLTGRSGVFVIDLNMSVGNMFEAFAALKSTWNMPTYYVGCTDDHGTAEWFDLHKQEWLARLHMDGSLTVPGFAKPAEECPADLLEKEPAPPRLNLLTPRQDLYPLIPDALMKDG
ncbi:Uncharacterized protein SCF082_LOCUS12523, partial [Durusdinium trenchii]